MRQSNSLRFQQNQSTSPPNRTDLNCGRFPWSEFFENSPYPMENHRVPQQAPGSGEHFKVRILECFIRRVCSGLWFRFRNGRSRILTWTVALNVKSVFLKKTLLITLEGIENHHDDIMVDLAAKFDYKTQVHCTCIQYTADVQAILLELNAVSEKILVFNEKGARYLKNRILLPVVLTLARPLGNLRSCHVKFGS